MDRSRTTDERHLSGLALGDVGAALLHLSTDGIVAADAQLRCTYWNAMMERLTGVEASQAVGTALRELLPHQADDGFFPRVLAGETLRAAGVRFEGCDRERSGLFDASYTPLTTTHGSIVGLIGIVRNTVDRKRVERELHETETRFRVMADASPVLLWMSGTDTLCTFFNQSWLDFTGRTLEEERGLGWAEGVHFEDFQRCLDGYMAAFSARRPFELEYRLRRADGTYRWILDRGVPRYAEGRFAGYIGSCIDITDRRDLEHDLQKAVRARDDFVNIASHDLRAPLGTLGLQCEAALMLLNKEGRVPVEGMRAKLDTMRKQVRRMKRLIDHLLDVSRADERQPTLQLELTDLVAVVHDACEQCREDLEAARCPFSTAAPDEILGCWDRRQLAQVITNLLTNAAKYGRGKPIHVAVSCTAQTAWIEVRDEGVGVAPEDQQKIFGRFERLASARYAVGIGLGLWISKRIVDAMGGKIDISSDVGRGATFTVILPRNVERVPAVERV